MSIKDEPPKKRYQWRRISVKQKLRKILLAYKLKTALLFKFTKKRSARFIFINWFVLVIIVYRIDPRFPRKSLRKVDSLEVSDALRLWWHDKGIHVMNETISSTKYQICQTWSWPTNGTDKTNRKKRVLNLFILS